jgi:hypothetical protein|tara:strand:- start:21 stop:536 length:516 start_codon:yes stop_codon:yes gene_type:complete
MKLFKISIISIISIFIFQSQLYGINLRCDFKKIIKVNEYNGVLCGDELPNMEPSTPICVIGGIDGNDWISKVVIRDKDVVITWSLGKFQIEGKSTLQIMEMIEFMKENHKVHSMLNHKKTDYLFVFNDSIRLYSLFFDNYSKKTILNQYSSYNHKNSTYSVSHFGECEVLD